MDAEALGLEGKIGLVINALSAQERAKLLERLTPAVYISADNPIIDGIYASSLAAMEREAEILPGSKSLKSHVMKPIQDFIVPIGPIKKINARISIANIDLIWKWYARDVSPQHTLKTAQALLSAQMKRNGDLCIKIIDEFRQQFLQDVEAALRDARVDDLSYSRFRAQLGKDEAALDLDDLVCLFQETEAISQLKILIKERKTEVNDSYAAKIRKFISSDAKDFAFMTAVSAQLMFNHNSSVQNMLRFMFASKPELTSSSQLASNPFAPCLELLLSELDIYLVILKHKIRDGEDADSIVAMVKKYYQLAKVLSSEIEFNASDPLGANFLRFRKDITETLKAELADLMPAMNRVVRQIRPRAGSVVTLPDEQTLEQIEKMLNIFDGIRSMSGEIALNDFLAQMKLNLEKLVEHTVNTILAEPCPKDGEAFASHIAVMDIIMRFAVIVFGQDYVTNSQKSFQSLLNSRATQMAG